MSKQIRLTIRRPHHPDRDFSMPPGVYPIGSDQQNQIVVPGSEIAWRHAILSLSDQGGWIEDLGSDTGTLVDDQRVSGRADLAPGSTITIGTVSLQIGEPAGNSSPAIESSKPAPDPTPSPPSPPSKKNTRTSDPLQSLRSQVHEELLQRLDIKRLTSRGINAEDLREKVQSVLDELIQEVRPRLPAGVNPDQLRKAVLDEALGLGPLEDLLGDASITEIMVNGPHQIYIEREGRLEELPTEFSNADAVHAVIERIVAPIGRRIDESQPYVDARLPDGSRVNAIIPPLSLIGPCLTIRKFSKTPFTMPDLMRFGSITEPLAEFIRACVQLRKNIIVAGGTGSGKTTLLNVISSYLPTTDRIVTIEDAAELRLTQNHVVRLESRPPNIEGRGAVTIRDLVRNALRMRPDRIVVGECRGGEALDMLQAMNTGHEGSLTTVHANSPRDVISRLETMVLMSGMELPLRAIREQVGAAVDLIVQISRLSDGSRRVVKITELVGLEGDKITMQDLFEFRQTGLNEEGRVQGEFHPTGSVPTFLEEMKSRGIDYDPSGFANLSPTSPNHA